MGIFISSIFGLFVDINKGNGNKFIKKTYYITEGKSIPITWEKSSKNSQTKYIVKETGKELVVNDGNTYIQIYPTSGNLAIS